MGVLGGRMVWACLWEWECRVIVGVWGWSVRCRCAVGASAGSMGWLT